MKESFFTSVSYRLNNRFVWFYGLEVNKVFIPHLGYKPLDKSNISAKMNLS